MTLPYANTERLGGAGAGGVVVGLSGGVDSAVTAALLLEEGYDVHAVALETWRAGTDSTEALTRAAQVADHLGIPLIKRDVKDAFYRRVVTPFLDEYARGQTPNPCVFCNPSLKFATLVEEADRIRAPWIATGHYARVLRTENGICHLLRGLASAKDQSYALYRLTQDQLQRLLLPLGNLESKARVREIARRCSLPSADTSDSQDLCFAVGTNYQELITALRPSALQPGPIYDEGGNHLGDHDGLPLYTIGQRSGLGIAASQRLYVLQMDPDENAIIVGPRSSLAKETCVIEDITFVTGCAPGRTFEALARIRYRAPLTPASVTLKDHYTAEVAFHAPQYGVAPGQSLVLYHREETLGGGVIAT
ncbi:MAG: tRNA 2-thiouridine(34) synthase MnmA [Anaerolineae bacterium]|nr:tRNA 2-thiouridine(34) synthase MnmA [Anaerolineae bacterium]